MFGSTALPWVATKARAHGVQFAYALSPGNTFAPVAGFDWAVETVKGQEPAGIHGTMQRWYAHGYNHWEPSPASVYTARIESTTAFAWLLVPACGEAPAIRGEIVENTDEAITISIYRPGKQALTVRIPWRSGKPVVR